MIGPILKIVNLEEPIESLSYEYYFLNIHLDSCWFQKRFCASSISPSLILIYLKRDGMLLLDSAVRLVRPSEYLLNVESHTDCIYDKKMQ